MLSALCFFKGHMELSKQKNYQQSFYLACASIKEMDLEERAKKAGVDYPTPLPPPGRWESPRGITDNVLVRYLKKWEGEERLKILD
jgi:hypothetical protein